MRLNLVNSAGQESCNEQGRTSLGIITCVKNVASANDVASGDGSSFPGIPAAPHFRVSFRSYIVARTPVARQRVGNGGIVFSAESVWIYSHATVEYVIPPLSKNCIATEERYFLRGPCRGVIERSGQ
jgi:hypothetical protein